MVYMSAQQENKNTPDREAPELAPAQPPPPYEPKKRPVKQPLTLDSAACLTQLQALIAKVPEHHQRFYVHKIKGDATHLRKCLKEISDLCLHLRKISLEERKAMPVKPRLRRTPPHSGEDRPDNVEPPPAS